MSFSHRGAGAMNGKNGDRFQRALLPIIGMRFWWDLERLWVLAIKHFFVLSHDTGYLHKIYRTIILLNSQKTVLYGANAKCFFTFQQFHKV